MAAILSSRPSPLSGRRTQTPMRSSRRSPATSNAASVRMIHSSSVATKRRTSGPRRLQVEHHIGDPLAGAVIGELAAAPADAPETAPRSDRPAWRWFPPCRAAGARSARPARARSRPRSRRRGSPWRQARPRRGPARLRHAPFHRRQLRRQVQFRAASLRVRETKPWARLRPRPSHGRELRSARGFRECLAPECSPPAHVTGKRKRPRETASPASRPKCNALLVTSPRGKHQGAARGDAAARAVR